ncbi:family S53 protease [Vararia minispora EC-137]|uniref:Family S53 protease n=1 Tax=Vararia minispora EC-137 TaxID=1314806 RepID=A0ACB8QQS3_9AGAM|nr:family S53 protease [Vararia minispora EC-137]
MRAVLLLVLSFSCVHATPQSSRGMIVHERRDGIPSGFVKVGPAPSDQVLQLRLGLAQGDVAGLEERLLTISTPKNPEYRQWLSKEEVEALVAPKPETIQAISAFLSENQISSKPMTPVGDLLSISVTVGQANRLFSTQFQTFKQVETGTESVRTLQYSIPASLKDHLDFVHPTTTFPQSSKPPLPQTSPVPKSIFPGQLNTTVERRTLPVTCQNTVTPACIQYLYNVPTTPITQSSNGVGVTGIWGSYASWADLELFLEAFRPSAYPQPIAYNWTFQSINTGQGSVYPSSPLGWGRTLSASVKYVAGLAADVPLTYYYVPSSPNDGISGPDGVFGFLDIANFVLSQSNPPHVLVSSFNSDETAVSGAIYNTLCNAYMQLGARGVSVIFSSGNGGVEGTAGGFSCTEFMPTFPAGCPYAFFSVTAVGGTNVQNGLPEVGSQASGGGFSTVFSRPAYQNSVVSAYLNNFGTQTYSGLYNPAGRGFPDVSTVGDYVVAVQQQEGLYYAGAGPSGPIFGSIIALLNDEEITAGRGPLGFLNPFLYSTGQIAFTDVTSGSNPGCNTNGFPAMAGWDPVTGLGTPNYAALKVAVTL